MDKHIMGRLARYIFKMYGIHLIIVLVCILASVLCSLQGTMFMQNLIDDYITPMVEAHSVDFGPLLAAIGRVAGFYALGVVCAFLYNFVMAQVTQGTLRALRDEAGYWWTTYRKAFKQNFKASILPGVLYCVVVTVQVFLVYFCFNLLYHGTNVGVGMWVATVLNLVIFHMLFSYMWPQVVLLDQPFGQTLKNSVNCMIAFLPHALAASLVTVLFWGLVILCMPLGLLLMLVFGFWFQVEITSQIVYGDLDRVFHIEENIRRLHDAEYEAEMAEERSDDEE